MGHGSEQLTKEVYIEEDPTKHVCTALDYIKPTIDHWIEQMDDEIPIYSLDYSWEKILPVEDELTVYDLYSPWKTVI